MNESITLALLKKLQAEGFTTLIASARAENDLVYVPSKEPSPGELMDNAAVTALSNLEILGIDEVIKNFAFYANEGIELEIDEGE
ncbi:hypothetical protein GCM10023231_03610 [Olivibacter ginsenosidimutans]|uniref:Uncharacterized protein n=1 Tax=Olivibacter ginsenosidimutans TaxID=1176537 RepID=A0ABP9AEK0_9SPHI